MLGTAGWELPCREFLYKVLKLVAPFGVLGLMLSLLLGYPGKDRILATPRCNSLIRLAWSSLYTRYVTPKKF